MLPASPKLISPFSLSFLAYKMGVNRHMEKTVAARSRVAALENNTALDASLLSKVSNEIDALPRAVRTLRAFDLLLHSRIEARPGTTKHAYLSRQKLNLHRVQWFPSIFPGGLLTSLLSSLASLPISTRGNDRSVFIAADGKTIYFASDGYGGFGGLDIFKTTLINDSTFGEVINIGAPFNTPNDDYGFILTGDGNEAYFIRDGDIFFADLKEADPLIKPTTPDVQVKLSGSVRDKDNWAGIQAEILLLDAYTKRVVKRIETDSRGRYTIVLNNKDKLYDQIVSAEGYPQSKKRLSIQKQYTDKTISSNFLLEAEKEPEPVLAENPVPVTPEPEPEPTKPDPEITSIPTRPDPVDPQQTKVEQPDPVKVAPPPDPYSFDGIAENNLILLLDVSASMKKPEKLPLLKESLTRLLDHMRPEDQISVIAYAGEVNVVLEGMSAANKYEILKAIETLRSGGGTKSKEALRRAYKLADDNYIAGGNNRIIFATDGYFDVASLYSIAERNAQNSSVHLTVFSFGKLADDKIGELQALANIGHGNFANINRDNVDRALLTEAKAVRK